eukprot:4292786-Pyramimonas_sp.AAC.1
MLTAQFADSPRLSRYCGKQKCRRSTSHPPSNSRLRLPIRGAYLYGQLSRPTVAWLGKIIPLPPY